MQVLVSFQNLSSFDVVCIFLTVIIRALVSTTLHLQSETTLFQRAVLMGGTDLLLKPLPDFVTEGAYSTIVKRLGLDGLTPSERVDALVKMESSKVLQNVLPSDPLLPSKGSELNLVAHTYEEISRRPRPSKTTRKTLV